MTFKEIQKLPSVRLYFNLLLFGTSSCSLSVIYAISKTLVKDSEIFSFLNPIERFSYLFSLKESLFFLENHINTKVKKNVLYNSFSELKERREKLALQFRILLLSTSVMYPHSITLGLPINYINLGFIIQSSKFIWVSLGLLEQDFTFLLVKEFFGNLKVSEFRKDFFSSNLEIDAVKRLFRLELENFCSFSDFLIFERDFVIFNSYDNIVRRYNNYFS